MEKKFRNLQASEIDCRVQQAKEEGCALLLYKDARVDMILLDETVGSMNWTRSHEFKEGKLYCKVGIYDQEKKEFVFKEDVGVESNTEQEKGQASDSFKRACVNWGIGRELYSAPFIWIKLYGDEVQNSGNGKKLNPRVKFKVRHIAYNEKNDISELVIEDQGNQVRYTLGQKQPSLYKNDKTASEKIKSAKTVLVDPVSPQEDASDPLPFDNLMEWYKKGIEYQNLINSTLQKRKLNTLSYEEKIELKTKIFELQDSLFEKSIGGTK